MGKDRPDLGVTSGVVSDWSFFQDHADACRNREAWVYLEIIKVAVQDAIKGVQAGIVDPMTMEPRFCSIMREDMGDWHNGAIFLKSPSCQMLCSHINAWSDNILQVSPETFIRLVRVMSKNKQNK